MYIYPSSPNSTASLQSEESAAIKIQAGFRGYRVRKQLQHQTRCATNGYHKKLNSWSSRRQYRLLQQNMERANTQVAPHSNKNDAVQQRDERTDSLIKDRSAIKIQAGVRGFLVRKKQKIATDAATKIQAGFRGFKVRKETQKLKEK